MPTIKTSMKTPTKNRNAYALAAKNRKAGEIRSRKEKRKNGKNKQFEYLHDNY